MEEQDTIPKVDFVQGRQDIIPNVRDNSETYFLHSFVSLEIFGNSKCILIVSSHPQVQCLQSSIHKETVEG